MSATEVRWLRDSFDVAAVIRRGWEWPKNWAIGFGYMYKKKNKKQQWPTRSYIHYRKCQCVTSTAFLEFYNFRFTFYWSSVPGNAFRYCLIRQRLIMNRILQNCLKLTKDINKCLPQWRLKGFEITPKTWVNHMPENYD